MPGANYGLMVRPDISTAAHSFVTMPLTMETTEGVVVVVVKVD